MIEPTEDKWIAVVYGDPNGRSWEISVRRKSKYFDSWGWFDENKLLVSHNGGPCDWPLAPGLGDIMVRVAEDLAAKMNGSEWEPAKYVRC